MPSSLPSFFLSLCTTPVCLRAVGSFRDGAGVVLGGLFPVFLPVGCPKNTPVSP